MRERELIRFLKAEGWAYSKNFDEVEDPVTGYLYRKPHLNEAYRIALNRKSARDTRRLKKAGFLYCGDGTWVMSSPHLSDFHPPPYLTKAEALAILGEAL